MKRTPRLLLLGAALLILGLLVWGGVALADDPFAGGADALAVAADDGSASLRAKLKLKKMTPDMVMIMVTGLNDKNYPDCVISGKVLKAPKNKKKFFKLLGRGKTYRFAPVYKKRRGRLVLKNDKNQSNLGACYYPPRTKLIIKVTGVDMKKKVFKAGEIYVK